VLAVAFRSKAAVWPLNFWLVPAYSAATAPAAALFAILTKVGVYALLRASTLLSPEGAAAPLGGDALLPFGCVTAALAALGMLGTHRLDRQAALSVIVSAGTLLAAVSLGRAPVTAGALFFLVSSARSASALFLIVDLVERWRNAGATIVDPAPYLTAALEERDVNLDDEEEPLVGVPFPASTAFLGLAFLACTVLVAGLPPLSSFVGKVAMLSGALGDAEDGPVSARAWLFLAVLLGTGLVSLVAMLRTGIRVFWTAGARGGPRIRLAESGPIVLLLGACLVLTVGAGPATRYALDTARVLHAAPKLLDSVLEDRDGRASGKAPP
jgi:multicomponent K+:H+ antiporter subunit D